MLTLRARFHTPIQSALLAIKADTILLNRPTNFCLRPIIFLYCLACGLLLFSKSIEAEWYSDTQSIMGTHVSVTLRHGDPETGNAAIKAVMSDMRRIDETLSPYKETSLLSLVNANAATADYPLSDELVLLIDKSLYFGKITKGAFDITFASLGWFYDYREGRQPSKSQRDTLLPAINYRWLELNKDAKTLRYAHPNVRIDLGGVAKGYAVDRAAKILKDFGVKDATVSAGGDSRVMGERYGRPWIIGIKNPRGANHERVSSAKPEKQNTDKKSEKESIPSSSPSNTNHLVDALSKDAVIRLPLSNVAVSTSGDYERFFIDTETNERVHHILNPATGRSAKELVSVTIIGNQGIDTDALSTSVFVLGVEKGLKLVDRLPGFDAVLIDRFGKVHFSQGLVEPSR